MGDECAPSEKGSPAARLKDRAVRRAKPGVEEMITVGITGRGGHAPTLRVKPLGAKCGEGFDVEADLAKPWAVYEVTDNRKFDETKPRSQANAPLTAVLLDDRDARDALPAEHPVLNNVEL